VALQTEEEYSRQQTAWVLVNLSPSQKYDVNAVTKGRRQFTETCSDSVRRLRLKRMGSVASIAKIAIAHKAIRVPGGPSNPPGVLDANMYAEQPMRLGIWPISSYVAWWQVEGTYRL
jgi:hypothetical protein